MMKDILENCVNQKLITAVNSHVKMEVPAIPASVDSIASVQKSLLMELFSAWKRYLGPSCEEKVDHCASFPCQNNGTCYSDRLSYSCSCSSGFTGPTCAQLIDFCALNPCAHGICRSVGTSYKCLCIPGTYSYQIILTS
ncbi:hypothetical protein JD844_007334, partial [Phrynosoma platyrhinos]